MICVIYDYAVLSRKQMKSIGMKVSDKEINIISSNTFYLKAK